MAISKLLEEIRKKQLAFALICLFALFLRMPFISAGLPYFYDEDEAHHFNRVANMVKAGDYDPHYFRKPSLHFYLRMPVLAVSFLWNVSQGHIKSLNELKTNDKYGIANFAFSTSHPGIVKWNRAFSVLLSLATVILTMLIALELGAPIFACLFAGTLTAVSPDILKYSATIGVDVLMTFMCLVTVYYALKIRRNFNSKDLFICSFFAGLTISSKYNALPIIFVPLSLLISSKQFKINQFFTSIIGIVFGFFIGSPYILSSLPLFLDHFAYEIWHYGIAGHEGHTANPGFDQALFYFSWFSRSAIGFIALLAAFLGLIGFLRGKYPKLTFLIFPTLFFVLMINQKTNFTRNTLVLIPFLAILSGLFLSKILRIIPKTNKNFYTILATCIFIIPLFQPIMGAFASINVNKDLTESRIAAANWIKNNKGDFKRVAIAGELQFSSTLLSHPRVKILSENENSLLDIYLQGFDLAVVSNDFLRSKSENYPFKTEAQFGKSNIDRILKDPALSIISFIGYDETYSKLGSIEATNSQKYKVYVKNPGIGISSLGITAEPCSNLIDAKPDSNEPYCWISTRFANIVVSNIKELGQSVDHRGFITLYIETMSPWEDQEVNLSVNGKKQVEFLISEPGKWQTIPFEIPYVDLLESGEIQVSLAKIASPKELGLSQDSRSLGLAIRNISSG